MVRPINEPTFSIKPKKSRSPDVGTYENAMAFFAQSTVPKYPDIKFSKTSNERFNIKEAKKKAFVPGSGNYNIE